MTAIRNYRQTIARSLLAAAALLAAAGIRAAETGETIDTTRTMIEKWVETRRLISREKHDFKLGREMLAERIALVHREIDSLKEKIAAAEQSISEADRKRTDLMMENERLKTVSQALTNTVVVLEARVRGLLGQLPPPLAELVKPLSARIPEHSEDSKLSLAERYQNVIGILNAINKFNRQISLLSEVRQLPDGKAAEVVAVYLGIGQAYYASPNGGIAGVGFPTADGWVWRPANEAVASILDVIAILNNEKVAAFVHLPATLDQK